jgi:hypothetical protein
LEKRASGPSGTKSKSRTSARTRTPDGTYTTYQLNTYQMQHMDRGWVPPTPNDMASISRSETTTSTTTRR